MNLNLDSDVLGYKSLSQKARVLTEGWAANNLYCPACPSNHVVREPNNREAVDFVCPDCHAPFQLKASRNSIGRKITDAAYETMKRAVLSDRSPNLLIMHYGIDALKIFDVLVVPKHFLSLSAVEPRKPLALTARRAGWIGCNIVLDNVPPDGRIDLVKNSVVCPSADVRAKFRLSRGLSNIETSKRGWVLDLLTALRSLNKIEFTLGEAYGLENTLSALHPKNRHVREKIRQQLQVLRDLGYLTFLGGGDYRLKSL
ncbi:MAG: restriction endonuclease [Candidatus Omnitrophica bacterium]|nr:restriction endonuclease [Candidatus Omnitrophota bacterium]MBI3083191.1 restriction endonuclease [Candidatus Omnitrophota bacterium]